MVENIKAYAPLRISFAGGGTDIEPYCSEYGGRVLSAAIRWYATAKYSARHVHNNLEACVAKECPSEKQRIKIDLDCQPMSGLGGSASCFVAGLKLLNPDADPYEIATRAFYLERKVMGIAGGSQDQYAASLGGLNEIVYSGDGKVNIKRVIPPIDLEEKLYLVYMGKRKNAGTDIIEDQIKRNNRDALSMQKQLAESMKMALERNELKLFGLFLDMAWVSKKQLTPYITSEFIDSFHDKCLKNGAIAGKLTGAGGGGYMLVMEHPNEQGRLKAYFDKERIAYHRVKFDLVGARCE